MFKFFANLFLSLFAPDVVTVTTGTTGAAGALGAVAGNVAAEMIH